MDWVWILGAVFSVWTVLRVIGAERQRRMQELIVQIAIQQAEEPRRPNRSTTPAAPVAPAAPAPGVRSKPAR